MIDDIHFPDNLTGRQLDEYLSRGWFRMGQTIFTTDTIPMDNFVYAVHWLRIDLQRLKYGRRQKQLFVLNKDFEVSLHALNINEELEDLFTLYRAGVDFNPPESVEEYLFLGVDHNIYDTHLIEVRDQGKLIAAGIFDNGETSIAGILNFYHPSYKKFSLGKYLMLIKAEFAIKMGKSWYYPGYIASGYTKFNYKLFPDKQATEIYNKHLKKWLPVSMSIPT